MNSFKDIAYQILKEAGKPLRRSDVTPFLPSYVRGITQGHEIRKHGIVSRFIERGKFIRTKHG